MAHHTITFCTLGMFIIDEIEYLGSKQPQRLLIGGAGTYAALGARLVAGIVNASTIGWVVDVGSDFPGEFRTLLEEWQVTCIFREDNTRLTTRAWNCYGANEYRTFKYLTPKLQLEQCSLPATLVQANCFHFVCSSERCIALKEGIIIRRKDLHSMPGSSEKYPIVVWEPIPDLCIPTELERFYNAAAVVDVLSPNAVELAGFFRADTSVQTQLDMAMKVLGRGIGTSCHGWLIVREGSKGCSAYARYDLFHLRPYHIEKERSLSKVVDPTGGGNTFLGALGWALTTETARPVDAFQKLWHQHSEGGTLRHGCSDSRRMLRALIYATVAASFVIEQPGIPCLSYERTNEDLWNGESFDNRLTVYFNRERNHIMEQLRISDRSVNEKLSE